MKRTAINPWEWSLNLGYQQGEVIEAAQKTLYISGQTSVDAQGRPQHSGDMRSQMALSLDNLVSVLKQAEMGLENIAKVTVYTTNVSDSLQNFDLLGQRFGEVNHRPTMTLLEVSGLAMPDLMFEIDAIAVS
ncbi:RidA family protein [Vibrio sonorensis]|uniref:RidA family protein n=1 Tax=Vibrio sonorensis TaxID=1004316 RepID=UPI0008DA560F|nr:RidA family protein [Vibrio sonorensis]